MTTEFFHLNTIDPSWKACLQQGLSKMDTNYLQTLSLSKDWLPGSNKIFNAFSLPIHQVNYVLFGESPYPRRESANGYAFWDAAVNEIWSPTGFSKKVNRATSFRNILKMLLVAEGALSPDHTSQEAIAHLNKQHFIQSNNEFFANILKQGFLLLNATPVLRANSRQKEAKAWQPFMQELLVYLLKKRPQVTFILLGQIANTINQFIPFVHVNKLYAEHPYHHTFITNPTMLSFFKSLNLLMKK